VTAQAHGLPAVRDRVGRTRATTTSSPATRSSSTPSIIVYCTPSNRRHTLTARNAVPPCLGS
jgi:hypothetical protein